MTQSTSTLKHIYKNFFEKGLTALFFCDTIIEPKTFICFSCGGRAERVGGVEGNKSPLKKFMRARRYARRKFYGNKEDHKEDSGKEDREEADPKDNADLE